MSIQSKYDQYMAELKEVRDFLSDPRRLALVKEFLKEESAEPDPAPSAPNPTSIQQPVAQATAPAPTLLPIAPTPPPRLVVVAEPRPAPALEFRGFMTQKAYERVVGMNEPFTARELIEKMREAGYEFGGFPAVSIQVALKKLIKERVLEIVEEGAGRHATVYQKRRK